jgi:hypothetical protein
VQVRPVEILVIWPTLTDCVVPADQLDVAAVLPARAVDVAALVVVFAALRVLLHGVDVRFRSEPVWIILCSRRRRSGKLEALKRAMIHITLPREQVMGAMKRDLLCIRAGLDAIGIAIGRRVPVGKTGSSRSSAWMAVFSSKQKTAACCEESIYRPMMSAAFSSNAGSLLAYSNRWGFSLVFVQMR